MARNDLLSFVEISKNNLVGNIKQFRGLLKRGTKISVAIKGNAYGHGQSEVVKILDKHVDYFQINSLEELRALRAVSQRKALLLGYVTKYNLKETINLGCELAVFSLEQLKDVNMSAQKLGVVQNIHIAVDTNFGREGSLLADLPEVFSLILKSKNIQVLGIYSHFANADDLNKSSYNKIQINSFKEAVQLAKDFGIKNFSTHISATAGSLVHEKNLGLNNLVRIGLGAYGLWPSEGLKNIYIKNIKLNPVLSWKTKVAQVKILPKASKVGYGSTFTTKKSTKIALIPQGYADGLSRHLSNKGCVLIQGSRCKILGRISMNMSVVDVNHLDYVCAGEEVVILGKQGLEHITAEEMAKLSGTINYEIVTRISPLLPRIIV